MLAVWERNLPHPEKTVLSALAWNANAEGKHSWPSIQTLADRAGYDPRHVHRLLSKLKARGILKVEGRRGQAHGFVTEYSIDLSGVPLLADERSVHQLVQTSKAVKSDLAKSDLSVTSKSDLSVTQLGQTLKVIPNKHAASSVGSLQSEETSVTSRSDLSLTSEAGSVTSESRSVTSMSEEQYEQEKQNRKTKQKDKPRQKTAREDCSLFPADAASKTANKSRKQPLPDWVPPDAWQGFAEMREQKRAPLTDRAAKLIVSKLRDLRESGQDIGAVLDQSTLNGWKGIFPVNVNGANHANHSNRAQQRTEGNLALLAEYRATR
jgi:hypothetical protein